MDADLNILILLKGHFAINKKSYSVTWHNNGKLSGLWYMWKLFCWHCNTYQDHDMELRYRHVTANLYHAANPQLIPRFLWIDQNFDKNRHCNIELYTTITPYRILVICLQYTVILYPMDKEFKPQLELSRQYVNNVL